MQHSSHILMIRPVHFGFNEQTAADNHFQIKINDAAIQEKASREFDGLVNTLRRNGIEVCVIDDSPEPRTPDSVFPNNWISFHENNRAILYPMFAENRRQERKNTVIDGIRRHFTLSEITDLSAHENKGLYLEGTGSLVLDRDNKIAYACLSARTHQSLVNEFCRIMNYRAVCFHAVDQQQQPIYHTNVMMCVADRFAVICLESIPDPVEKDNLIYYIDQSNKEIIAISHEQMNHFAGNMLQVHNSAGEVFLVMSEQAYLSLNPEQIQIINNHNKILTADISTIETNGGGSARCMMAEIFLDKYESVIL